jgi:hypothetical protein
VALLFSESTVSSSSHFDPSTGMSAEVHTPAESTGDKTWKKAGSKQALSEASPTTATTAHSALMVAAGSVLGAFIATAFASSKGRLAQAYAPVPTEDFRQIA